MNKLLIDYGIVKKIVRNLYILHNLYKNVQLRLLYCITKRATPNVAQPFCFFTYS